MRLFHVLPKSGLMAALFAALMAASAQAASHESKAAAYDIDPSHTDVVFRVNHLGFSNTWGRFNEVSGSMMLDEEHPEKSSIEITIKAISLDTAHDERDFHLRGPDFFNVREFPTIEFKSTAIEMTGDKSAKITGDLTMHGTTKPVSFEATLNKIGPNPLNKEMTVGFSARGALMRSDFGIDSFVPAVGDEVHLYLEVEAVKAGE